MGKYDDIINMEHPTSRKHPGMPIYDRAAQFSPFAALTGHDAAIKETARLTDEKIELTNEEKYRIDQKLQIVEEYIGTDEKFTFTYFVPDEKKTGGSYKKVCSTIKKIDKYSGILHLENGSEVPIESLSDISSNSHL